MLADVAPGLMRQRSGDVIRQLADSQLPMDHAVLMPAVNGVASLAEQSHSILAACRLPRSPIFASRHLEPRP